MSQTLTTSSISNYLCSDKWKILFSDSNLAYGKQLARSRRVEKCKAEYLSTEEIEIVSYVSDKSDHLYETVIVLWLEDGEIQIDASCSCSIQSNCMHCVATIEYLIRGERLAIALGETPHLETVTREKSD